ncbi:WD40-like Beta Propeller Repeat [Xylanibacter ruminicola]|uniref:WD40-like Beta Propeller Repeat n=1 Tax=Xylanibacter ruminicola TaxID=839 RepID=A0A1H5VBN6_XYLRU|nr:PD40 domain-containing protein [Xylanibacter ruminicola]SEF84623.1 WD40-like Beta Propeller Repeat [Xylanibacter ruminicola]
MRRITIELMLLVGLYVLSACTSSPHDVEEVASLPEIYPDYIGVTVPEEIAPLNFSMTDDEVTTVDVEIKGAKGGSLHANGAYADFDIDAWHELLKDNRGSKLMVSVCAEKDGTWKRYREFEIYVSQHPLDEWGITYRRIAPGYQMYGHMGIYQRELSTFEETAIMDNRDMGGGCVNCHTANRGKTDDVVVHIRSEHGGTSIVHQGKKNLLPSVNDSIGGPMVYPYWHPQGRYIAFSTNKTSQLFHSGLNKRIEVFDGQSDVFIYDTETNTTLRDTLIMKKYWAENCPAFSPDGKWLYFTTARRQSYPQNYDQEKYSLCRVAFDAATGKTGHQADTLINTSQTGMSVTWPRPSYDGRYLMYTQLDYGYFSVWHPEADLWLLDLETGETRSLDEVNSEASESLHNWSENSHWFYFTTRRDDGLYTQVYFSSIDERGKATKPFLLPQKNPKRYYHRTLYSFNTPDFISSPLQ